MIPSDYQSEADNTTGGCEYLNRSAADSEQGCGYFNAEPFAAILFDMSYYLMKRLRK